MKMLSEIKIGGVDVLPIVEGGKGISITNGESAGAMAAAGAIGTFSGVNGDSYDEYGNKIPHIYLGKTRNERFKELVKFAIEGGIEQAKIAYERSNGCGRIHMNILWEMGGAEQVLDGVLSKVSNIIHGVTCGAGMPYNLSYIAAKYNIYYYPIVSSARAFEILYKRSYKNNHNLLGGVVYEDPWIAGGHNGLSNSEDPNKQLHQYPRLVALRKTMIEFGLTNIPIIVAGGVWWVSEWSDYIDNKEIGPIAFQFGTRTLLTKESPISNEWKKRLLELKDGDVSLNKFSPTGFYSSAVKNDFLIELEERSTRQIYYSLEPNEQYNTEYMIGQSNRSIWIESQEYYKIEKWNKDGFTETMRTPDSSIIFVDIEKKKNILEDQKNCMGCLSHCRFSNWKDHDNHTTGHLPDPRSFCIQKTLYDISHNGSIDNNLMFAGKNVYKFKEDPFYRNGFIPTVKQLVDRISIGY